MALIFARNSLIQMETIVYSLYEMGSVRFHGVRPYIPQFVKEPEMYIGELYS